MMEVDVEKRLRLKDVNISDIFGTSLLVKTQFIPKLFVESNDSNLEIVKMFSDKLINQADFECTLCKN